MGTITTASGFAAWVKTLGDSWTESVRDLHKKFLLELPANERYKVQRGKIADFFVEENRGAPRDPVLSPSGRYKLVVTSFTTGKGSWNYTLGEVFRVADGEQVARVMRNYSSFFFSWMENHVDSHDYLVCGEDYQGQTFCQLDTGEQRNLLPDDAFEGFGFCWSSHRLLEDGKTLLVDGCYWACPYEYRLYDVSDPMGKGWPGLQFDEDSFDEDEDIPYLDPRGDVRFEGGQIIWEYGNSVFKATGEKLSEIDRKQSEASSIAHKLKRQGATEDEIAAANVVYEALFEEYPDEEDSPDLWEKVVDHRVVMRTENHKLYIVEEWKSEYLLNCEQLQKEWEDERQKKTREWREGDALIQQLGSRVCGVGFLYPSKVLQWDGDKNPAYFRISGPRKSGVNIVNHSATLEWGVVEGDVKVELWVRGKGNVEKPVFPRTLEGVEAAWSRAMAHINAEVR